MSKRLVFFAVITALIVAAVACAPAPAPTAPTQPAAPAAATKPAEPKSLGPLTLELGGWTYDNAKVMQNLQKYQEWAAKGTPAINVKVTMSDAGYGDFDTFVTTRYAGGKSFDVLYSSDHWLAKWAAAGWVVPLEDYFPEAKGYAADITPFALQAMTYKGKQYGLPYYADTMFFVYNKKMLADAGISVPPTTWAEVTQQALTIKNKGLSQTPVLIGFKAGSWFEEDLFAMFYSEGGKLFDDKNAAVFDTDKGPIFDMIEWVAKAINDDKVMPAKVMDMTAVDVQQAFKNGDAAFVIVPGYMMKEFNTPGVSKIAGQAAVSMMPGKTHNTNGFTRMYLLGKGAVADDAKKLASLKLIEFFGGKATVDGVTGYHIAKRWSIENGLGFAFPSLWSDPAVDKAFSAMADTNVMKAQQALAFSKQGMSAPWFAEWISSVRSETQKAMLRQAKTADVLNGLKTLWGSLAK
jgi:multiple sugar transport system substrate-binding protein